MAKFASKAAVKRQRPVLKSPVSTTGPGAPTFEGGAGFSRDAKSDLFLLAATNMVGEDTFYESAEERDARFVNLVHQVTVEDPEWVAAFIPYLRKEMFMRSASVVAAAEYVAAGGPHGRAVVTSALARADEPGEILAYWHAVYGRNEPIALKRGVADAITGHLEPAESFEEPVAGGTETVPLTPALKVAGALYTQNAALKYDGLSVGFRMGDVIERVHPAPLNNEQRSLFNYLLGRRHNPKDFRVKDNNDDRVSIENLSRITNVLALDGLDDDAFAAQMAVDPDLLTNSGYTWERLLSARPKLAGASLWESIIPNMGYMALLRNLRNFEQAGIAEQTADMVISKLTDPDEVARSMQFPLRFLSAYKFTEGFRYAHALDTALDLSVRNIPKVEGRTLILIDVSGSMTGTLSEKSTVARWEAGALFGVAQYLKSANADIVAYATRSQAVPMTPGTSVLRGIEKVADVVHNGRLEHGTNTFQALEAHYAGHDRLFIFSDMQSTYHFVNEAAVAKLKTIYNFNLGGYAQAHMDLTNGRYELGGFSDATFRLISLLERGKNAPWPWEIA